MRKLKKLDIIHETLTLIGALSDSLIGILHELQEIISLLHELDSYAAENHIAYYKSSISDIQRILEHNSYTADHLKELLEAICSASQPIFSDGIAKIEDAEAFKSILESLDDIDDDCEESIEDAREQAQQIASSISELAIEHSEKEKNTDLRRKQLADALRKGEPISISQSGDITNFTADAIATLREQLTESGGGDSYQEAIRVPSGMLAGSYGMCRICGTVFHQKTNYCPYCGTKAVIEKSPVQLDKVFFSVVAPKSIVIGEYSVIDIFMYEEGFRSVVEEAIANAENDVKETKSGMMRAGKESNIKVILSSPDLTIEDNIEEQVWHGEYLDFTFAVELPEDFQKKQILFVATVYINDVIATRLKFIAKCMASVGQKMEVTREDILSAFVSYASQDRNRVAMIIQGMKKARPDMDIFFDVESLRSGDDWERTLWHEIDKRDVLFLCWSKSARESQWVDAEWRYALKQKGPECIEPVPIDPPGICPPPEELSSKHFNDKLLYIINSDFILGADAISLDMDDDTARQLKKRLERLF